MKFLDGLLLSCESNILANLGELKTWDGLTASHLFREMQSVHGRLVTATDTSEQLKFAMELSLERPNDQLWDSMFIRRLVLSCLEISDFGITQSPYLSGA